MADPEKPKRSRRRAVAMVDKGTDESRPCPECREKDARIVELEAQLADARAEAERFKSAFAAKRR